MPFKLFALNEICRFFQGRIADDATCLRIQYCYQQGHGHGHNKQNILKFIYGHYVIVSRKHVLAGTYMYAEMNILLASFEL